MQFDCSRTLQDYFPRKMHLRHCIVQLFLIGKMPHFARVGHGHARAGGISSITGNR